jgi:UDP:flavonoid glycosyltransferase YjiC (YdhE family)
MVAFGTRGDVQPAIALALGLQTAGHTVTLAAGVNFENWVRGHGLGFVPTLDMEALMRSPEGIAWVEEPNPMRQLGHMKNLLRQNAFGLHAALVEPAQDADLILSGFVSAPFAQAVSEKYGIPMINMLLQPYPATRSGAASLVSFTGGSKSVINLLAGKLGEGMIWNVSGETTNAFRGKLGLPPHSSGSYLRAVDRVPTIFGFSPHVVPPPDDWGEKRKIAGYWFLNEGQNWQPPDDLLHFIGAGTPPIYIGFGSMSSSAPQETFELIEAALKASGQRGIVAAGWGGAHLAEHTEQICVIEKAPHDWLFERVAAVVHHGGAGTTGAGLRAGKPTLVIPHMSDQPFWGRRVYELGVGAKPVPRHKLNAEKLAAGIKALFDAQMIENAAWLGERIRAERGVENGVQLIRTFAETIRPAPRA